MAIRERGEKQQKTFMKQWWLKISPNFISVQTTDPRGSENQSRGNAKKKKALAYHFEITENQKIKDPERSLEGVEDTLPIEEQR